MSKHIYLCLAIHNHQPLGNFDFVFTEAYRQAYLPFVELLELYPEVRLALHYTGPLRDWLAENHPDFLERVAALAKRGQVEIMTGGYYEPILVAIPDGDKTGQIRKMTESVRRDFGYEARGAWLAERVWEPHLAKPLAENGVEYVIVDDTHFKWVGMKDEDLFGYYITEEQGATLKILPTSKYLRYAIPWDSVEEVMAYLEREAAEHGPKVAIMGDDGEKFGLWPGTYKYVWEGGWMEEFFKALTERADLVETILPGEYVHRFPPLGRIYLPTASYDEMSEWALPAELSAEIKELKHRLKEEGREDILRFIRGGFWRYFLVKYPEVNTLHKKMLRVHRKIYSLLGLQECGLADPLSALESLPPAQKSALAQALDSLWAAQCNCPYWHGVFGGIYLPHIRTANYRELLQAENVADRLAQGEKPWVKVAQEDFDADGRPELLLESEAMNLYFDLSRGGSLFEWDWRAKNFNLLNTLTRRPEGYHRTLLAMAQSKKAVSSQRSAFSSEEEVKTIHEIVQVKEEGLEGKLFYDWYRRGGLIDHFLHPGVSLEDFQCARYGEAGDFVDQPYVYQVEREGGVRLTLRREGGVWCREVFEPMRVEKLLEISGGLAELPITYTLTNIGSGALETRFGVEFNFALLSGHAKNAFYRIPGRRLEDAHLDSREESEEVKELALLHRGLGLEIRLSLSRAATLWRFPIETISSSEGGFERVYQCSCIVPLWAISLGPGESWQVRLHFTLTANSLMLPQNLAWGEGSRLF